MKTLFYRLTLSILSDNDVWHQEPTPLGLVWVLHAWVWQANPTGIFADEMVSLKIGGVKAEVLYAGPQGSFVGLDQLNALLPRSLAGRGEVEVAAMVDGKQANALKVAIE